MRGDTRERGDRGEGIRRENVRGEGGTRGDRDEDRGEGMGGDEGTEGLGEGTRGDKEERRTEGREEFFEANYLDASSWCPEIWLKNLWLKVAGSIHNHTGSNC